MALRQIAARIEGDVFQGMVFWLHAAMLLRPQSMVVRVGIENDGAAGVDDVSVEYASPGIDAGGRSCAADYFQVKYHVDHSSEYCSNSICDPGFIGATRSLLQRFNDARARIGTGSGWSRLNLVSNWQWDRNEALGPLLRESDEGALPDRFFSAGGRSALGKIRDRWREHLALSDADFEDFARRLRLRVDYLSRRGLRDWVNERLINVGLQEIPVDKSVNPYDSLTQQLVMNGTNSFDRQSFLDLCKREGLLAGPPLDRHPVLGVRSFMRFAERMEDECAAFVCVANQFEGRHIRSADAWDDEVQPEVASFLRQAAPALRVAEHHLLLDCHCSLAFLAGYELDRKSGAQVFPVQKGIRTMVWKPQGLASTADTWSTTVTTTGTGSDVAFAISVSRDALGDVALYASGSPTIGKVVDARPVSGTGQRAVTDADHAVALADSLADVIRALRPIGGGVAHLFIAAPNALAFFLGQHRLALGRVQLYEFDFEGEQGGSYVPSIHFAGLKPEE